MIAALVAVLLAANEPEGFHYSEQRRFYDVVASDYAGLRKRMLDLQLHGPNDDPSSGMTTQRLRVSYDAEHVEGGCRLRDVEVALDVEIVLPRLVPRHRPPRDLLERWNRMLAGLTLHEDGHRDNAVRGARELVERLNALPVTPCKDLRRAADRAHDTVVYRMQMRDQMYDQRTEHGVRQGSVL